MNAGVRLIAPAYVLGEDEADHESIGELSARAADFRMEPKAELWGWGMIHRSRRSLQELAIASMQATLSAAELDTAEVEAVVLCSTRFPGGAEDHGSFVADVLLGAGLRHAAFLGLTLNRCANFLAGIQVAEALVIAGRYRTVLVVSTDRVENEQHRMEKFALFSDGAASCLLTAEATGSTSGYQVLGSASAQDARELGWENEISADLSRQVNEKLLAPLDLGVRDLTGLMHANLFTPLVVMKERLAGFGAHQLNTDNIHRVGHCFAADPIINLVDQATAGTIREGGLYLLASSVPGSRIGVLLRASAALEGER